MLGNAVISNERNGSVEKEVLLAVTSDHSGSLNATLARPADKGFDYILDLEAARCEIMDGVVRITGFQAGPDRQYRRISIVFSPIVTSPTLLAERR